MRKTIRRAIVLFALYVAAGGGEAQTIGGMKIESKAVFCIDAIFSGGRVIPAPDIGSPPVVIPGRRLDYQCNAYGTGVQTKDCPAGTTQMSVQHLWFLPLFYMVNCYGVPSDRDSLKLGDFGDSFYDRWTCNQSLVNKFWYDLGFKKTDWDDGFGYYFPCANDRPLNRTFNALWTLHYSTADPPVRDYDFNGDILRWGYNYVASNTDELGASMSDDFMAVHIPPASPDGNHRIVLNRGFFYYAGVPERAAALIHEARHAVGYDHGLAVGTAHDNCSCPRGGSCDYAWPENRNDWRKSGSNVYETMYLWLFSDSAVNTTSAMRRRALLRAQSITSPVSGGFCERPSFIIANNTALGISQRIHLRSSTAGYLHAVRGGGGELDADSNYPYKSESFTLVDLNGGFLKSGDTVWLRTYNGYYVVAENGGGGDVRADRNIPRLWEKFTIREVGGDGHIQHGDEITIQARSGQYLRAIPSVFVKRLVYADSPTGYPFVFLSAVGYGVEVNTDRSGNDYRTFDLWSNDPASCRWACFGDDNCRAWTYVNPGNEGPQAVCRLKDSVTGVGKLSSCCSSGTIP